MATFNIEWTKIGGAIPLYYITSRIINNGIVRKYASSQEKHRIDGMVLNDVVPQKIYNYEKNKAYIFSNVSIYMKNSIVDNNISTWELHSDDGSGHFIVRLYRELGYIELEVIEKLDFLC